MTLHTALGRCCQRVTLSMVLSLSWKPASHMAMKYTVATIGIPRLGLDALLPVGSCFNPTFKSESSDVVLNRSTAWTRHRFVCSILTSAELRMITAYVCRLTKSTDQRSHSLQSSAVMLLQLECRSSARAKSRNGRLLFIIILNVTRSFLRRIHKPTRSNTILTSNCAVRGECYISLQNRTHSCPFKSMGVWNSVKHTCMIVCLELKLLHSS